MLPTSGLAPLAMLGIWRTGRRVVPLNFLVSEDDRTHIFADSSADACVTVRPMVEMFGPPPPGVRTIYLEDMPRRLWNGILPTRPTPDEVATGIIFAIENEFITGTTIDIDGGWLIS